VGVGAGVGVAGALVMDQGVGRDVLVDEEGGDADAEACEVVANFVFVADTVEGNAVFGGGDRGRWRDVVCEAAVFVEVDD